jgi:hypothetical protein
MSTLDQLLKGFRQSHVSEAGGDMMSQDAVDALEADWFQKFLAETLAGIDQVDGESAAKRSTSAAQVPPNFYPDRRPAPTPQVPPVVYRVTGIGIRVQLKVFEAAEKERRRELIAREDLMRSDVAREIQEGIQLLQASWFPTTVKRLLSEGVSYGEISIMAGYSGQNGKRDTEKFLEHSLKALEQTRWRRERFRAAVEERRNRAAGGGSSTSGSTPSGDGGTAEDCRGSANAKSDAGSREKTGFPFDDSADGADAGAAGDSPSEEQEGPRAQAWRWCSDAVNRLRAAGVSNSVLSKMAGYSGHNGKRDIENFLRHVHEGDARAKDRIVKFRSAVEEWDRSPEAEGKGQSGENPAPPEEGAPTKKEGATHHRPTDSESDSDSSRGRGAGSVPPAGASSEERKRNDTEPADVEFVCEAIENLRSAGVSDAEISKMASYSGLNGTRDLENFVKLLREGDTRAQVRCRQFRRAVEKWERSSQSANEPESEPVEPGWFRDAIDRLRDSGVPYGEISKMAGYSGHNGKRDVATFLKHLLDDDARIRIRIKHFRRAMERWEKRRTHPSSAFPRLELEETEEEDREKVLEEESRSRRRLILDNTRNLPGGERLWIPTMVEHLREAGVSWGDLSKMAGYSGRNGMRDLRSFLRHIGDKDEKVIARINTFREAVARWEATHVDEGQETGESDDEAESSQRGDLSTRLQSLLSAEKEGRLRVVSGEQFMRHDAETQLALTVRPATWFRETVDRLQAAGLGFKEMSQMAGFSGLNGERDLVALFTRLTNGGDLWRMKPFWDKVSEWDRNRAKAVEDNEEKSRQEIDAAAAAALTGLVDSLRNIPHMERFWVPELVHRLRELGMGWNAISQMAGYSGGKGKRDVESFLKQVQSGNENAKPKVDKFRVEYATWERSHPPSPPPAAAQHSSSARAKPVPFPTASAAPSPSQPKGFFFPAPSPHVGAPPFSNSSPPKAFPLPTATAAPPPPTGFFFPPPGWQQPVQGGYGVHTPAYGTPPFYPQQGQPWQGAYPPQAKMHPQPGGYRQQQPPQQGAYPGASSSGPWAKGA